MMAYEMIADPPVVLSSILRLELLSVTRVVAGLAVRAVIFSAGCRPVRGFDVWDLRVGNLEELRQPQVMSPIERHAGDHPLGRKSVVITNHPCRFAMAS